MYACLSRGLVSIADLAAWKFSGDEAQVEEVLKRTPNCMKDLLSLDAIPDVVDEEEKKLMKIAESTPLPGGKQPRNTHVDIGTHMFCVGSAVH